MSFSDVLSSVSLLISLIIAYRTTFARFRGKVSMATRVILTHFDKTLCLGAACFFENSGALPGILDDLRLVIKHNSSATITYFYPQVFRNDYSIYASYKDGDWFPFSSTTISPRQRIERYVIFMPLNNEFKAQSGDYGVTIESRWQKSTKWDRVLPDIKFTLPEHIAFHWNNPESTALQVLTQGVLANRDFDTIEK